jgi:Xaa-Pro aminopeptidase
MLVNEKVKQAVGLLNEFGIDCWITFVRESSINGDPVLPFLVNADVTWHSAFIINSDGSTKAIVGLYDKKAIEDINIYDVVEGYITGIKEPLLSYLKTINPSKIAINYSKGSEICDGLTYGMFLTLHEFLSEIGFENRLISSERIISALRERKTNYEIDIMKKAIFHTEDIFDKVSGYIKAGLTEEQVAEFMRQEVKKKNIGFSWDESVCPSVFSGPDTADAHYSPTERIIEKGHVLNMDFGVKVENYVSDMQRTFYILKDGETDAPDDVKRGFNTIVNSIEKARLTMRPGVEGYFIDAVCRSFIVEQGYEEFPHALGHQVGRFAHDGTALLGPKWEKYAEKPMQLLEEGMVFTLEPRLTVAGKGVATIEEMVIITKEGAEFLSHPQKKLILI